MKNKASVLLIGVVFIFLNVNVVLADVTTNRPRVWIDNAIKNRLQQDLINNTPEWQELKNWCDSNIGSNLSSGYQGMGWYKYTLNYGLCFQATGNQTYGNEGVVYLKALLRDKDNIGDNLGGTTVIQTDSGWVARTFGSGVGIGRDWLDGASNLTLAIIQESVDRLSEWITWFDSNGYGANIPADNYYAGYFAMKYIAGYSLEGDTTNAAVWRVEASNMWTNEVVPLINGYLDGGDWQERWNYGEWASRELLQYPHIVYTSTGKSSAWDVTNWYEDLINSKLHMLYPGGFYFSDDGSWSGSLKGNPTETTLLFIENVAPISQEKKGLISWFINNLSWDPYDPYKWEAFLWPNNISSINPSISNMGKLSYLIEGTSRLLARSDEWTNDNATFVEFACPDTGAVAEGEMNVGEFKIASRGKLLVVDADTWQSSSEYGNVLLINGSHTYAPNQEWWRGGVGIDRYRDDQGFVYARGFNLANAYDGNLNNNPSASFYGREIVFVRPNYVFVMDSVVPTSESTNTITSQVNFMGEPIITGNSLTVTNGNAKIFMNIRGHNVDISKTDKSNKRNGVWLSSITPNETSPNYKLLHIFQTADSATQNMDTVVDISGIKIQGAQINKTVVLFNKNSNLVDITGDIQYTVSGQVDKHILIGLSPGETYSISRIADNITLSSSGGDYTVSAEGTLYIENFGTEIRADVDQNSTINSTDAMLTLRNSLGLDMSSTNWVTGTHTGDVNCDNTTNSTDAMLILRKSLDLDMSGTGWCAE